MIRNTHDEQFIGRTANNSEDRVTKIRLKVQTALKDVSADVTSVCNVVDTNNREGCVVMIKSYQQDDAETSRNAVISELQKILVGNRAIKLLNDEDYRKIKRVRELYFIFVVMYTNGTYRYY